MTRWLEQLRKPLVLLALFIMLCAIVRACVQSVVIDEAETAEVFAGRAAPVHWEPASNNHVLNSLLIRLSTLLLGLSQVSIRLPALFGAMIYICAAYWLAQALSAENRIRIPVFLCLAYNPMIYEFYSVGRGYSFALAGLIGALALVLWGEKRREAGEHFSLKRVLGFASALLGISFSSNFSFGFVDFAALGLLTIWAYWVGSPKWRAVGVAIWPMLAVTGFFCSWTLVHWPKGQLWDGATSLRETFQSLGHSSLYQLNPHILNPLLLPLFQRAQHYLLLGVGIVMAVQLGFCVVAVRRGVGARWLWMAAWASVALVAIALGVHSFAHVFFGLLLPRGRTALYIVPLVTLFVAVLTVMPAGPNWSKALALGGMWALAISYVLSMRISYTELWQYEADGKEIYWRLAYLSKMHHVHDVFSNWRFGGPARFYQRRYGADEFTINWATDMASYPKGKEAYVLYGPFEEEFAKANGLKIVYRGADTGSEIAVDPEVDPEFYGMRNAAGTGLVYDDTSAKFQYSGKWTQDGQFKAAWNSTLTYSNTPGNRVRFAFKGVGVTLVYTKALNRGVAEVLVDGKRVESLDLYSAETEFQRRTSFGPLVTGSHVIEVRVTGTKNPKSSNCFVDLDAIEVE